MSRKQKRKPAKGRQLQPDRVGRWWVRPAIVAVVLMALLSLAGFLARPPEPSAQAAAGARAGEAHTFYGAT